MKSLFLIIAFFVNGLFCLNSRADELNCSVLVSPADPVVGDLITVRTEIYGGTLPITVCWDDSFGRICSPVSSGDVIDYFTVFPPAGEASIYISLSSGNEFVERTVSFTVYDTVLRIESVKNSGRKFTVTWSTRGVNANVMFWVEKPGQVVDVLGSSPNTGVASFEIPGYLKGDFDLWISLSPHPGETLVWKPATTKISLR